VRETAGARRLAHLRLLNLDGNPLGGRLIDGGPTLLQVWTGLDGGEDERGGGGGGGGTAGDDGGDDAAGGATEQGDTPERQPRAEQPARNAPGQQRPKPGRARPPPGGGEPPERRAARLLQYMLALHPPADALAVRQAKLAALQAEARARLGRMLKVADAGVLEACAVGEGGRRGAGGGGRASGPAGGGGCVPVGRPDGTRKAATCSLVCRPSPGRPAWARPTSRGPRPRAAPRRGWRQRRRRWTAAAAAATAGRWRRRCGALRNSASRVGGAFGIGVGCSWRVCPAVWVPNGRATCFTGKVERRGACRGLSDADTRERHAAAVHLRDAVVLP
jgi:hypothetical protein